MSVPTYTMSVVGMRPAPGAMPHATTAPGASARQAVARAVAAAAVVALQLLLVLGLTGVAADPGSGAAGPAPAPYASATPTALPIHRGALRGVVVEVDDHAAAPLPGPAIPPSASRR